MSDQSNIMSPARSKKKLLKVLPIKNIPVVSLKTLILLLKEIPQCSSCRNRGVNYICQKCVILLKSIIIKNKDQTECMLQSECVKKEKVKRINTKKNSIEKKSDLIEEIKNDSLETNFLSQISYPINHDNNAYSGLHFYNMS